MPRRNPSSPTAAPTYCESRLPATRRAARRRLRRVEPRGDEHDRRRRSASAEQRPRQRSATARSRHRAGAHRAVPLLPRRRRRSRGRVAAPMPTTRTSLPAGAVVPSTNRWRASRSCGATASSTRRSTPGPPRGGDARIGTANSTSRTSAGVDRGEQDTTVNARRRIQPTVENSDRNRWSSANTWSRSTDSRSRYSGRSWCSIVATDACSSATCDSRATLTRSRKRRWTRSNSTRMYQVPTAETRQPDAATTTLVAVVVEHAVGEQLEPQRDEHVGQRGERPSSRTRRRAAAARRGSRASPCATASCSAGGRSSCEQVVRRASHAPPPRRARRRLDEARRLQLEHRAVAAAVGHQLVVGAELDHPAVLDHADAVGQAHRREAVRHEDRRAVRGSRRAPARRSRPRRARRAARSARRAAPRPAPSRTAHSARASATRCHCPPERSVPPS